MFQSRAVNSCKRRPNDRSILNEMYHNTVGRNMLLAFGHSVATCGDMLGVVGSSKKTLYSDIFNM